MKLSEPRSDKRSVDSIFIGRLRKDCGKAAHNNETYDVIHFGRKPSVLGQVLFGAGKSTEH